MALKFWKRKKKAEKVKKDTRYVTVEDENLSSIKGMRVNFFMIFFAGTALLLAAIMFYLLIIQGAYGRIEVDEILPTEKNIKDAIEEKTQVALLYSGFTEQILPEGSTWISDIVTTWENFLTSHKIKYDIISDSEIEVGVLGKYKLLIAPGAKAISDREKVQIRKFLKKGGNLFATTGIATFSPEGKWDGWDFFTEVFGMKFTKEIDPEEGTKKIHTIRGNLPITAGVPTGYTLNIATWDRPIYAEVLEPRTIQASYWYDFRHERGLVLENIRKSAGISFGHYGKGRFVWYGFELNSVIGDQEDYIYFDRLFYSSVSWLLNLPTIQFLDWPANYKAAAIFVPTIVDEPNNFKNLSVLSKFTDITNSVFTDVNNVPLLKNQLRKISELRDIGLILDIGYMESFDDTTNSLYSLDEQREIIKDAKILADSVLGVNVTKIMPLNGFFNTNTLQAMSENGMDLVFADSLTDRLVPKMEIYDGKKILVLSNTSRDDYVILRDFHLKNPEFQEYTYYEDIDRIYFTGGLYVLKVHTDGQLRTENIAVLKKVLNYLHEKEMWVTSIDELKKWWFEKNALEVKQEVRSKRRIAVEISNPSDEDVKEFMTKIFINKPVYNVRISSDIINTEIPEYNFDERTQILYLYIDELKPHETRSLLIDYENYEDKYKN